MTDFKMGQEVVNHHGKQTEPQAVAHFQKELMDLQSKMSGNDATVSKNLSHYNFQKLDNELHKAHNGTPAELDKHMHVAGVYKIDHRMQVVFTDDIYKKSGDRPLHAYTIDEKTGKVSAVFDMKKTENGKTVLERHKEKGENQTDLKSEKHGDTTVLKAPDRSYTEYQTPDGRIVKVGADGIPTVQHPKSGPTETYTQRDGKYDHQVANARGQMETRGAQYEKPQIDADGTITTKRAGIDFTTREFPNGNRAEYTGSPDVKHSMLRITEQNGRHARLTWDDEHDAPKKIAFTGADTKQPYEMELLEKNVYAATDGVHWKVDVDTTHGTIHYDRVHFNWSKGSWVTNDQEQNESPKLKLINPTPAA